jgi:hypothetical protein
LAKSTAKALTTKDGEKQQLANGNWQLANGNWQLAIGKTNCKSFNHKGRRKAAIGKWQLAKSTAKALTTTEKSSNWQLANGKINCKSFNHKGHEGTQRSRRDRKTLALINADTRRNWKARPRPSPQRPQRNTEVMGSQSRGRRRQLSIAWDEWS